VHLNADSVLRIGRCSASPSTLRNLVGGSFTGEPP
jgi:hypothetical protein